MNYVFAFMSFTRFFVSMHVNTCMVLKKSCLLVLFFGAHLQRNLHMSHDNEGTSG